MLTRRLGGHFPRTLQYSLFKEHVNVRSTWMDLRHIGLWARKMDMRLRKWKWFPNVYGTNEECRGWYEVVLRKSMSEKLHH